LKKKEGKFCFLPGAFTQKRETDKRTGAEKAGAKEYKRGGVPPEERFGPHGKMQSRKGRSGSKRGKGKGWKPPMNKPARNESGGG